MSRITRWLKQLFNKDGALYEFRRLKFPIYSLGSPDPLVFISSEGVGEAASAIDTKLYVNDEYLSYVQGISFGPRGDGAGGTCVFLLFDNCDYTKWLGKEVRLKIVTRSAADKTRLLYDAKIKFDEYESLGISVYDIMVKASLNFTVIERYFEKTES